jgi:tRNA threonylcarbamoyladenosine biosynthesis protein TsaB
MNGPDDGGASLTPALLAFDTSTDRLHLGLASGSGEWVEDCPGGAGTSAVLIRRIRALLATADLTLRQLDAIAFGCGPGAFTGLRTACAAAQGLALGASRPVVAVDSLMAVAEDARQRAGTTDLWVAVDARMGEVYAARYFHLDGSWQAVEPPALHAPEALGGIWRRESVRVVAGNAMAVFAGRIDCGSAIVIGDALPRALSLLACARANWLRGEAKDAAAALPTYLRNRVAMTTAERDAVRAASLVG